ncbi:MAG: virulence RhuM family protein [Eubacteriales bacterium]|nr:virulence RhuM family protein [Eubacteriales bacterium]
MKNEMIIYHTEDGRAQIHLHLENGTIWLNQSEIAELFQTTKQNVSKHIKAIFADGELEEKTTVNYKLTVQVEGIREIQRTIAFYSLDMILAIGYRVRSVIGMQFRNYATTVLKEYLIKGFAMDDEKLKNFGGGNYWDELKTRIRDIRTSEKVFYRQVLDIYATSIDYDAKADTSIQFFKMVQNKIHYAVHGSTAAEVIYQRIDSEKEYLGLLSFLGSKPTLKEAKIAKNYLTEKELKILGQLVEGYLAFAERQADRQIPMTMKDWVNHLDSILTSTGEKLLQNAGKISHELAMEKVKAEYKKYQEKTLSNAERDYLREIKALDKKLKGGKQ